MYSSQQEDTPVLELSSSMDIGEHPGGNRIGNWMITGFVARMNRRKGFYIKLGIVIMGKNPKENKKCM